MTQENKPSITLLQFLPNFCTTLALFFGFLAITSASIGLYNKACICIIIAWIADCIDGRVARMTGNESEFGKEYDSLSDLVSFGVAPAFLAYKWVLFSFHKVGWCLAFIYVVATALRLARFNTEAGGKSFTGLPCPGAAGVIVAYIWLMITIGQPPVGVYASLLIAQLIFVSFAMISNLEFKHMKYTKISNKYRLCVGLGFALLFGMTLINPPLTLYLFALIYALWGFCFGVCEKLTGCCNKMFRVRKSTGPKHD